jgi:hypothetical protein
MESMPDKEINRIVSNDREWRKHIFYEMRDLRKEQKDMGEKQQTLAIEMNTLKVKVAIFASAFGTIFGAAAAWFVGSI